MKKSKHADAPIAALDDIFDFMREEQFRDALWGWLKATVAGNFHEWEPVERDRLLRAYEYIQRLVATAAEIQRNTLVQTRQTLK